MRWMVWTAAVVVALGCWAAPDDAVAAMFTVTLSADLGDLTPGDGHCDATTIAGDQCTLRAAIRELNAQGGGPHTVTLLPAVYTLTRTGADDDTAINGDLDITANITIVGVGPSITFIQACDVAADAACIPSSGTGDIAAVMRLKPGGSLRYRITATVAAGTPPGTSVAATASITPPGGINDPNSANNSATDTFVFGSCAGRPPMSLSVQPAGAGRLLVTLAARKSSAQIDNAIRAVQLGTLRNAAVDVPPQASVASPQIGLGSGARVSLSGPVQSLQFVVRRVAPGAFTAPLTATDNCGPWQTFAGGGTGVP